MHDKFPLRFLTQFSKFKLPERIQSENYTTNYTINCRLTSGVIRYVPSMPAFALPEKRRIKKAFFTHYSRWKVKPTSVEMRIILGLLRPEVIIQIIWTEEVRNTWALAGKFVPFSRTESVIWQQILGRPKFHWEFTGNLCSISDPAPETYFNRDDRIEITLSTNCRLTKGVYP